MVGGFELLGTAILTLGMNFGYKLSPDIVSCGLFVAILLTYRITGSHLNAGITIGVGVVEKAFSDKKKRMAMISYLVSQLIGAYVGMLGGYILLGHDGSMNMGPSPRHQNLFYAIFVEFMFSWIFFTIYLHAKVDWVAPS